MGGEVERCCRAAGMRVISIDERRAADVRGAAQEPGTLWGAERMLRPDVCICCTSSGGGDVGAYRHCYEEVAEALARTGGRVVFCSTCSVYEEEGGGEVTEERESPARWEKTRVMLRAERVVREAGGVVARLAALYGEGRCEVARRYIEGGERLAGSEFRWVNYVHVGDAARALTLLAECGEAGQVYNVCAETIFLGEIYRQMDEMLAVGERGEESRAAGRHGRLHQRVRADKLRALGWRPQERLMDFVCRMIQAKYHRIGHA